MRNDVSSWPGRPPADQPSESGTPAASRPSCAHPSPGEGLSVSPEALTVSAGKEEVHSEPADGQVLSEIEHLLPGPSGDATTVPEPVVAPEATSTAQNGSHPNTPIDTPFQDGAPLSVFDPHAFDELVVSGIPSGEGWDTKEWLADELATTPAQGGVWHDLKSAYPETSAGSYNFRVGADQLKSLVAIVSSTAPLWSRDGVPVKFLVTRSYLRARTFEGGAFMSYQIAAWIRSVKALVPERAIVPRASTISSRLMPMPLSSTVRRRFSASISKVIRGLGSSPSKAGLVIAS